MCPIKVYLALVCHSSNYSGITVIFFIFNSQYVMSYRYTQHIFLAFFWLAMANSALNPLVYFSMNAK